MKKTGKEFNFGILILLLIIIAIAIAFVFYFGREDFSEEEEIAYAPEVKEFVPDFGINLKFCSDIDDNFNCLGERSVFTRGEDVWTLISVNDLKADDNYVLNYAEEREIYGHDGILIQEVSGVVIEEQKDVASDGYYDIYVKNQLLTSVSDPSGEYTVNIRLKDLNTGLEDEEVIAFVLE